MPRFRTKARAVDLLGKGQIADLPTAISELWKNGYDAYADELSCDLYMKGYANLDRDIFTLSDDGHGMSLDDIKEKWIVLGTDSKVRGDSRLSSGDRLGKDYRIPLGEKGIGRLSVAYLGSPMLMITKKKSHPCYALFMDWRILENYNLFLDDVDIPIGTVDWTDSDKTLNSLCSSFSENLNRGNWDEHQVLRDCIADELGSISLSSQILSQFKSKFLEYHDHGTLFVILNPHDHLNELRNASMSGLKDNESAKYIRSSLSGIHNIFKKEPSFKTMFYIHSENGNYDLVSNQNFFSREDIFMADHWISGSVDEEGFFEGEAQVFNRRFKHRYRPIRPPGITPYGPFKLELGTVEGDASNSKLPREKWDIIKKKLEIFGGLYVYRDDFRILPYGRTEADFLRFEERRSQSATYYQFSHRRMLGYIAITRDKNPDLKDKAGREGFIANKAYREFQQDLIGFFSDFSVKFLRTPGKDETISTLRSEQLVEIKKISVKAEKAEKNKRKMTKTRFRGELRSSLDSVRIINSELHSLKKQLQDESENIVLAYNRVEELNRSISNKRIDLRESKLPTPNKAWLTKVDERLYYEYKQKQDETYEILGECDELSKQISERLHVEDLKVEYSNRYSEYEKDIQKSVRSYQNRLKNALKKLDSSYREDIKRFYLAFSDDTRQLESGQENDEILVRQQIEALTNIYSKIRQEIEDRYESFTRHIEGLDLEIDDETLTSWYKEQYDAISEKVEAMHELAQLGMAIEIIDHQFYVLYSEMSSAIEFFKKFTKDNPSVERNYLELKQAFEHMETNHQLLTPLYRTTRRSKTIIKGSELIKYLNKFFTASFKRHQIVLEYNTAFEEYEFNTYESVIKPVFINIINNALYWIIPAKERKIRFTFADDEILIMNSGEQIDDTDLEDIFKLFYTKKPGGRGIGLYLAKTNLRTIGYDIYATNDKKKNIFKGACFVICEYKKGGKEYE